MKFDVGDRKIETESTYLNIFLHTEGEGDRLQGLSSKFKARPTSNMDRECLVSLSSTTS